MPGTVGVVGLRAPAGGMPAAWQVLIGGRRGVCWCGAVPGACSSFLASRLILSAVAVIFNAVIIGLHALTMVLAHVPCPTTACVRSPGSLAYRLASRHRPTRPYLQRFQAQEEGSQAQGVLQVTCEHHRLRSVTLTLPHPDPAAGSASSSVEIPATQGDVPFAPPDRGAIENWLYPAKEELPEDFEMPIWDHLEELRERVLVAALACGIAILTCFGFSKDLVVFLEAPVAAQGVRFLQLSPGEFFFTTLKVRRTAYRRLLPWKRTACGCRWGGMLGCSWLHRRCCTRSSPMWCRVSRVLSGSF